MYGLKVVIKLIELSIAHMILLPNDPPRHTFFRLPFNNLQAVSKFPSLELRSLVVKDDHNWMDVLLQVEGDCQLLFQMPSTNVYGAKNMPIETKNEMHCELVMNKVGCKSYKTKRNILRMQRNMPHNKICHGGTCSLVINKELLIIPSLVFSPCKYHLCGLYDTHLIVKRHLLHLMWILTTCSIHNNETFMWDRRWQKKQMHVG